MPLTAAEIRALQPSGIEAKVYDSQGLYLLVSPNGSKHWKMRYTFAGKERKLSFGRYPEVSLKDARKERDEARQFLASGADPSLAKKKAKKKAKIKATLATANTFHSLAEEYIDTKMVREGAAKATVDKARWFLSLLAGC
ncbi:MAG: Arm DNA-binding domain-containing protein [Sphingorhabdus sp.]